MKNSTKTLFATLAVVFLVCAAVSPQAQAVMITGGISLGGSYTTDTGDINTATAFTSFPSAFVVSTSGDYSGVPLFTSVTQNPFSFDPFVPNNPLWTFMVGTDTYSFDLTTITLVDRSVPDALTLKGTGDLNITGFDTTDGSWTFTANQAGGTFSFSSSNGALTPDGGSALILFGLALGGLEALRRKLAVA
jgi:VPDSG-CTERM motif